MFISGLGAAILVAYATRSSGACAEPSTICATGIVRAVQYKASTEAAGAG